MTGPAPDDPAALLDRVEARLAAARNGLEGGALADLDGLDGEVAHLRDRLAALPGDQARPLRPRLIAVLDEIDRLSTDLRAGLDRLGRELGATGRRRQAVSAYSQGQQHKPGGR
jgi:hypothetical protein